MFVWMWSSLAHRDSSIDNFSAYSPVLRGSIRSDGSLAIIVIIIIIIIIIITIIIIFWPRRKVGQFLGLVPTQVEPGVWHLQTADYHRLQIVN